MVEIFFIISIIGMIFIPAVLAGKLRRTYAVPWIYFSIGIATFIASQIIHLPLNHWLGDLGFLNSPADPGDQPLWQIAILLGLTAGLCEELARAAGFYLFKSIRKLPDGLMVGLGHGGFEAMTFGGILLASAFSSLAPLLKDGLDPVLLNNLPNDQVLTLQSQVQILLMKPWNALIPLLERILAIGIHLTLSSMVLQSIKNRNPLWLVLAVIYHMVIDAVMVFSAARIDNALILEGILLLIALPGYAWLGYKIRLNQPTNNIQPNPIRRELKLLTTALSKEMMYLWRTKRILIVTAVFGLFGLASPMLAYFMPNLMTAIPGAEAFADLIPPPTAGEAVTQYHKNITQFAFLLAIILGMGGVAGEKERGTATLILSKPLPRWAFLCSKLIAQFILFAIGIIVASAGGLLYTIILFGEVEILPFLWMNLILIWWIFPFSALTLVGSVLGATTTAAGGISFALVSLLLLSSNLPLIGNLMPSTLSSWAAQLGIISAGVASSAPGSLPLPTGPITNNYGALASALSLILICIFVSLGFFENQEL